MRNFGILDDEKFLIGFFFRFCNSMKSCVDAAQNAETFHETNSLASNTKPICLILLVRTNGMNNSFYLMFLRLLQPIYHKIKTHKNFGEAEDLSTRHDMQMICSFRENWLFLSNFLYSTSRNCNDDSSNACKLFLVAQWNILQPNMMKLSAVLAMHETKKTVKLVDCDSAQAPKPSYYAAFSFHDQGSRAIFFSTNGH